MSDDKHRALIELDLTPAGNGTIKVDGYDISNRIYKVELMAQAGKVTEVTMHFRAAEVKVIGSAWVTHKLLTIDPDTASSAPESEE